MTAPAVAELTDVRKRHGRAFTLEIPRLRIGAGEILAVLGPTGAGKTTLLSLLATASVPDDGELRLQGRPLTGGGATTDLRRKTTMVFQRPLMLSGTVRRNVEFGLRTRGTPHRAAVDAALERLGLEAIAQRSAATLSGGETQLVALARALVIRPKLLLLDEPTASLDAARVALVEETIRAVVAETSMAVAWATHNLFQAKRVASRVALLLDGRIIEEAATDDFFHCPRDERTAAFVDGRFIY